jgi:prepilin-type N-terminal cleavage/methylation domain-containing protein
MKIKSPYRVPQKNQTKNSRYFLINNWSPLSTSSSRGGGFTLIEVILTMTILAVGLVMILQLFSIGLRTSRTSCDYSTAVVYAKDIMEELSITPVQGSGIFEDKFEWESEVLPYEEYEKDLEETGFNIMKLKVKVSWEETRNRKKAIQIVSLKAIETEDE